MTHTITDDVFCGVCERTRLQAEVDRLDQLINTPEVDDFLTGVRLEAAHQQARWSTDHDAGKAPEDWFWLIGYLGGKCLRAAIGGEMEKAKHHTISVAAVCLNWHGHITGRLTSGRNLQGTPL